MRLRFALLLAVTLAAWGYLVVVGLSPAPPPWGQVSPEQAGRVG